MFRQERFIQETVELIKTIVLAAILALIIRSTVVEAYKIPSTSMTPTLEIGDRLIVNKFIYYFKKPQHFEVVVFAPPAEVSEDKIFIKRVIGLPGDIIEIKESKLFLNGEPVEEGYLNETINYRMLPVQVPEGKIFVMGDNRNHSFDSHIWGMLSEENLLGKAFLRYYPFYKAGLIR